MHSPIEPLVDSPPVAAARPAPLGQQARWAVAVLVVCALAALFWPRGDGSFSEPGGFLYDASGKATTMGPLLAPVSLVHFWATWCPPCIQEIPSLQRLSADFADQSQFTIVMGAVSDSAEKVRTFAGSGADMVLYDPNWDVAKRYGTDKLPETYLVVGRKVVKKFVGAQDWDNPELRELLRSHLSGATKSASVPGAETGGS
ncbi:MAG TPA: TlpA disulfide reductase family protein [Thermoanaerobaculia bacterium]|nr:TlpA disulfide reductase family protein [Thermoanaerobaculia bacterium]